MDKELWTQLYKTLNQHHGLALGPGLVAATNSRVQGFWVATRCKNTPPHAVFCTPAAISKNPSCLICKVCNIHEVATVQGLCKTIDTVNEPKLWLLVQSKFKGATWAVQCKVVRGWPGTVDMCLFGLAGKLVVQVDGSSHSRRHNRHLHSSLADQLCIDARFNQLAHDQGVGVLRLHVNDFSEWDPLLASAIVQLHGRNAWPLYMASRSVLSAPPSSVCNT